MFSASRFTRSTSVVCQSQYSFFFFVLHGRSTKANKGSYRRSIEQQSAGEEDVILPRGRCGTRAGGPQSQSGDLRRVSVPGRSPSLTSCTFVSLLRKSLCRYSRRVRTFVTPESETLYTFTASFAFALSFPPAKRHSDLFAETTPVSHARAVYR
jgi:hypothetical protein